MCIEQADGHMANVGTTQCRFDLDILCHYDLSHHGPESYEAFQPSCWVHASKAFRVFWGKLKAATQNDLPHLEYTTWNSMILKTFWDQGWFMNCTDMFSQSQHKNTHKQKNGAFIEGWVCSAGDSPDQGTIPVLSALWHYSGLVWSFALLLHWARKDQWRYKMF